MSTLRHLLPLSACVLTASFALAAAPSTPIAGRDVKSIVTDYFSTVKGHTAGDLITRKQVREVLDRVEKEQGKLPERAKLEQRTLVEDSFLAEQFHSTSGKKFMRQISSMPLGYDQIDRMAQLPQGRSTVERLVRGPDGYKLLEYMTQAKGGKDLAKMLSKDGGGNFSKPTGKIYTAEQLVKELEK